MNKLLITFGFVITVAAQWFVPAKMIYDQELVLAEGTPYKFKTRPIDPSDPFRGKFITLNYEVNSVATSDTEWTYEDPIYVYITESEDGFAKATRVSKTQLQTDQDYVLVDYRYYYNGKLHFNLPFDRFYMEEGKANDAEIQVRSIQMNRDSLAPVCYALVYVKDDIAVLDNVFIGDVSVKELVEQEQQKIKE